MAIDVSAVGLLTAIVAGAISFVSRCVGGILLRYVEANLLGGGVAYLLRPRDGRSDRGTGASPGFQAARPRTMSGPASAYTLGLPFAFGWTPP